MTTGRLIIAALTAATLAACSADGDSTARSDAGGGLTPPVRFGTYMGRTTASRADMTEATVGTIGTDAQLQASTGFGVMACYTGSTPYPTTATAQAPRFTPNFMYNERVAWNSDSSAWEYWPLKFWPNDTDDALVSFFAYAPYTGQDDADREGQRDGDGTLTEKPTRTGITAISGADAAGDPTLHYRLDDAGRNVDLLWGTCRTTYSRADGADDGTPLQQTGDTVGYEGHRGVAAVNVNLRKPAVTDKITFNFRHALAKVGGALMEGETEGLASHGLQVQLDLDRDNNISGGAKPDRTKVTIVAIDIENDGATDMDGNGTVEPAERIAASGTLNLATGEWTADEGSYTAMSHHLRTAATAATGDATIAPQLAEPASLAHTATAWDGLVAGVLTTPQNVYLEETVPMVFIPGTRPAFTVTIEYIVRTRDEKLDWGYTEVRQRVTKSVTFGEPVALNRRYNLVMHLGLTDVKFTASVDKWTPDATGDDDGTATGAEVYLPINVR